MYFQLGRVRLYILGGRHYPNWGQSRVGLIIIFLNNNRNNGTTDKKDKIKYVLYLTSTFEILSPISLGTMSVEFFGFLEIMKILYWNLRFFIVQSRDLYPARSAWWYRSWSYSAWNHVAREIKFKRTLDVGYRNGHSIEVEWKYWFES